MGSWLTKQFHQSSFTTFNLSKQEGFMSLYFSFNLSVLAQDLRLKFPSLSFLNLEAENIQVVHEYWQKKFADLFKNESPNPWGDHEGLCRITEELTKDQLYSMGYFTTFLGHQQNIPWWEDHLSRLKLSEEYLQKEWQERPGNLRQLANEIWPILTLFAQFVGSQWQGLWMGRPTFHRKDGRVLFLTWKVEEKERFQVLQSNFAEMPSPVRCLITPVSDNDNAWKRAKELPSFYKGGFYEFKERAFVQAKIWLNEAENLGVQNGFTEALLTKRELLLPEMPEIYLEFSKANVAWIDGEKQLYLTPETAGVLQGITQQKIVSAAQTLGIPIVWQAMNSDKLLQMTECFAMNSGYFVRPVGQIYQRDLLTGQLKQLWKSQDSTLTKRLAQSLQLSTLLKLN